MNGGAEEERDDGESLVGFVSSKGGLREFSGAHGGVCVAPCRGGRVRSAQALSERRPRTCKCVRNAVGTYVSCVACMRLRTRTQTRTNGRAPASCIVSRARRSTHIDIFDISRISEHERTIIRASRRSRHEAFCSFFVDLRDREMKITAESYYKITLPDHIS